MPRYVELTGTVLSTLLSNLQIHLGQVTFFWLGLKALWEEFSEYWQGGLSGRGVCLGHKSDRFLKGVKGKPDLCLFGRVTDHDEVGGELEWREMQVESSEGFLEQSEAMMVFYRTQKTAGVGAGGLGQAQRARFLPSKCWLEDLSLFLCFWLCWGVWLQCLGDMECQGSNSKI